MFTQPSLYKISQSTVERKNDSKRRAKATSTIRQIPLKKILSVFAGLRHFSIGRTVALYFLNVCICVPGVNSFLFFMSYKDKYQSSDSQVNYS